MCIKDKGTWFMRVLVFSDNHRNRARLLDIMNEEKPYDHVISLGDSEMSEAELQSMGIIGVKGNYPFEPNFPNVLLLHFGAFSFFIAHGHTYQVKSGLSRIYQEAKSRQADVVLFGHTHQNLLEDTGDLILCNPGSLAYPKDGFMGSYAVIEIQLHQLKIEIKEYPSLSIIKSIQIRKRSSL